MKLTPELILSLGPCDPYRNITRLRYILGGRKYMYHQSVLKLAEVHVEDKFWLYWELFTLIPGSFQFLKYFLADCIDRSRRYDFPGQEFIKSDAAEAAKILRKNGDKGMLTRLSKGVVKSIEETFGAAISDSIISPTRVKELGFGRRSVALAKATRQCLKMRGYEESFHIWPWVNITSDTLVWLLTEGLSGDESKLVKDQENARQLSYIATLISAAENEAKKRGWKGVKVAED